MMTIQTNNIDIKGASGEKFFDFLLSCNDQTYNKWWPGTHLSHRILKSHPDYLGNVIYIDEFIGKRRVKFEATIVNVIRGKEVTYKVKKIIKLPIWWTLKFKDYNGGVVIDHEIKIGYKGIGRILNPLFKLYFTKGFKKAMAEHARTEFFKLRDLLC